MTKVSGSDSDNFDLHLIELTAGLRTVATAEASTKILMDFINRLGQREAGINAEFDPEELASLIR